LIEFGILSGMKRGFLIAGALALIGWAAPALAAAGSPDERNFTMEEAGQLPFTYRQALSVPREIQQDPLYASLPPACGIAGKDLQLADQSYGTKFYIFTTAGRCGWIKDETAPAWILRLTGGRYTVILSTRLHDLSVRRIAYSSALRNLAIGSILAGRRTEILWVFDRDQDRYVPTSFPIEHN
jgi:hypothetical protein